MLELIFGCVLIFYYKMFGDVVQQDAVTESEPLLNSTSSIFVEPIHTLNQTGQNNPLASSVLTIDENEGGPQAEEGQRFNQNKWRGTHTEDGDSDMEHSSISTGNLDDKMMEYVQDQLEN